MASFPMPDAEETLLFKAKLDLLAATVVDRFREDPRLSVLKGDNPWIALEDAQRFLGFTLYAAYRFENPSIHRNLLPWF